MRRTPFDSRSPFSRFGRFYSPGGGYIITATLTPVMSRLYDGQSVQDVTNWASFIDTANYASSEGTISSAFPSFSGDALAADTVLSEGDTAGFNIAVTDSAANGRNFTAAQITVEYKVNVTETGGSELDIDVNSIVADGVALGDIVISGSGAYNGTYTGITAGDVRYEPYNLGAFGSAGLPTISGTAGGTLTGDYGLWGTPTGTTLTLTPRWLVDDVLEAGETGLTIDSSAYPGTTIKFAPSGNDGTTTVIATSAGTAIPGGSFSVTEDSTGLGSLNTTGTADITDTITDVLTGDEIYVLVTYGTLAGGAKGTVSIGGLTTTEVVYQNDTGTNNCGIYKATALADGSLTLTMAISGAGTSWRGASWTSYIVQGRGTADATNQDQDSWPNSLSLDLATVNGDVILAVANMAANGTTGDFTPTGLSEEVVGGYIDVQANRCHFFYRADPTSTETRTMTLAPTGDGTGLISACAVRIRA